MDRTEHLNRNTAYEMIHKFRKFYIHDTCNSPDQRGGRINNAAFVYL